MKIAYVLHMIEPTGGDHILYNHIRILQEFGHEITVYYAEMHPLYPEDYEFKTLDCTKLISSYDDIKVSEHDIIIANGYAGAAKMVNIDHPNKAWFIQNFDPWMFERTPEMDYIYNSTPKFLTYCHELEKIIGYYYGDKRLVFCPNGINYQKMLPFQKKEYTNSKRVFFMSVYYGRLKGVVLGNEIFGELKNRGYTTVEINVVNGPMPHTMELHRSPSFERKCEIVSSCDICMHPSIFETWGMVPMESMALGVPIVGVNSRGIMEFATEDNAILIEERDAVKVADEIDKLCEDEERYNTVRKNAIETVEQLDWDSMHDEIENAYQELYK